MQCVNAVVVGIALGAMVGCSPGEAGSEDSGPGPGGKADDADDGEGHPWVHGIPIGPGEPPPPGDPAVGRDVLVDGDYIGCGAPSSLYPVFRTLVGELFDGPPLPDRLAHNEDLPFFLSRHSRTVTGSEVVAQTCLFCHAAEIGGEVVIGAPASGRDFTVDWGSLLEFIPQAPLPIGAIEELNRSIDRQAAINASSITPSMGTNPADSVTMALFHHHDPDSMEWIEDAPLADQTPLIPVDVPAWWTLHKKNAAFWGGLALGGDFRGSMTLATTLCNDDRDTTEAMLEEFIDVQAFLVTLRPPAYPFEIDDAVAVDGETIFNEKCAACHGRYGAEGDETFPNLLFPLAVIGTDPLAARGWLQRDEDVAWFEASPFGQITAVRDLDEQLGYMAPPLDGIWASAPYFHNGSVPTLAAVLRPELRPTFWERIGEDSSDYDEDNLGWPTRELDRGHQALAEDDRWPVFDTTLPGHDNGGHDFFPLSDAEFASLLEYLKTL